MNLPRGIFRSNAVKASVLILLSIGLLSCESIGFYSQAARGQLAIVLGREDIEGLLRSETLSESLQQKFEKVLEIREFAATELGLHVGEHYSTYVDIEREHVVWNVFAAPEFSIDSVNWCYPIAGCVAYRGYFSERAAMRYASKLKEEGYDVYTGGVDAYSTLGWFEDSLLSTVLGRADHQLAGLIFHELSHQVVYLAGDTTFNESFATAVEKAGVRLWLAHSNEEERVEAALLEYERQEQFVELVTQYRQRFEELYGLEIDAAAMRQQKAALQQAMRDDYALQKQQWQGYAGYDAWFARSLNNAQLLTVSSYNDLLPFFDALLADSNNDFASFYEEVDRIAKLSVSERDSLLGAAN